MKKQSKYFITGFSGFVSRHYLDFLDQNVPGSSVFGVDLYQPAFALNGYNNLQIQHDCFDLLNEHLLADCLVKFQPDYIIHLASASSVAYSWQEPAISFQNNVNVFLSLLEVIRKNGLKVKVLSVGSSEIYGNVSKKLLPIKESTCLDPLSPYAIARVAQEMISKVYVNGYGQKIILTRSFNHLGPGQKEIFAVSSFAKQLVLAKRKGLGQAAITAGDISIVRDFLDVRDVVRAYHLLLRKGENGAVYNICSGRGVSIKEVINRLAQLVGIKVTIKVNKALIRPNDNEIIIGSNQKIKRELNWQPAIPLERSLQDIINYWKNKLGEES
jgi:GDP-4-dehydro-6-deoxy-D-mannose reductase